MSLATLPNDVCNIIFSFLPRSSNYNLSEVSQKFRGLSHLYWKNTCQDLFNGSTKKNESARFTYIRCKKNKLKIKESLKIGINNLLEMEGDTIICGEKNINCSQFIYCMQSLHDKLEDIQNIELENTKDREIYSIIKAQNTFIGKIKRGPIEVWNQKGEYIRQVSDEMLTAPLLQANSTLMGASYGRICMWDLETNALNAIEEVAHCNILHFSENILSSGHGCFSNNQLVKLRDIRQKSMINELKGYRNDVMNLMQVENKLLTCASSCSHVWDLRQFKILHTFKGSEALEIAPLAKQVLATRFDEVISYDLDKLTLEILLKGNLFQRIYRKGDRVLLGCPKPYHNEGTEIRLYENILYPFY